LVGNHCISSYGRREEREKRERRKREKREERETAARHAANNAAVKIRITQVNSKASRGKYKRQRA
jgi:hypothetical protein